MPKVNIEVSLEIPPGLLVYDIGLESFCCKQCGSREKFQIIDAPKTRCSRPSDEQAFKNFVAAHATCIGRFQEAQRQIADRINEERGGPGDR